MKVVRVQIGDLVGPDQGITKFVEGAGVPIGVGAVRHDPCATDGCDYGETCIVGSGCSQVNTNYMIHCMDCNPGIKGLNRPVGAKDRSTYLGQSGTTMHKRMRSHLGGLRGGGVLGKHLEEHHGGADGNQHAMLKMKSVRGSRTVLDRLVQEGTNINNTECRFPGWIMNSKSE